MWQSFIMVFLMGMLLVLVGCTVVATPGEIEPRFITYEPRYGYAANYWGSRFQPRYHYYGSMGYYDRYYVTWDAP